MPETIATIFHISDMHLYVRADGKPRSSATRRGRLRDWLVDKAPLLPVLDRMACHDERLLGSLRRDLPNAVDIARAEYPDSPVIIAQTGDVEGLGGIPGPATDWREAFPSWHYLDGHIADSGVDWIHIFGNHDTWPGVFPLFGGGNHTNCQRITQVPVLEGNWQDLAVKQTPLGFPLVIGRVNSVPCDLDAEIRATGSPTAVPPDCQTEFAVIERIRTLFAPHRNGQAVRIVLMHHPPHPFATARRKRHTTDSAPSSTSEFSAAADLADALSDMRVQVVLAGHRHELNPPLRAERYGFTQHPLKEPTVQLVAATPTQRCAHETDDLDGSTGWSFSKYRLLRDDGGSTFAIERTVFQGTLTGFRPDPPETTFDQIPLQ